MRIGDRSIGVSGRRFGFPRRSKPNDHHVTPLDVLIGNLEKRIPGRRPDLAFLNLTCANTTTSMPYIDIVNEILESYVALGLRLDGSAARDSANSTSAELDANPQYVNQRAYEILDQAVYPFTLPFNRPLLVTRSYLNQLGASRREILKTFQKISRAAQSNVFWPPSFSASARKNSQILTGQHFDPKPESAPSPGCRILRLSWRRVPDTTTTTRNLTRDRGRTSYHGVATFLQRAGISFADLHTSFHFVHQPPSARCHHGVTASASPSAAVHCRPAQEQSHASREALVAIESSGISLHDLNALKGHTFNQISKMVVIDDTAGSCDPHSMKINAL